ncbi:MAG: DUF2180 family protein [Archaeoglobales archaeon]|nr:DUF2180 family protein [Archaeoglobales archaeon]
MFCHVCEKNDEEREAVAICIVCGRGICYEHSVRDDVWEADAPFPVKLCTECSEIYTRFEKKSGLEGEVQLWVSLDEVFQEI